MAAELGVGRIWIKDESDRFGLPAFKMLGASWACFRALSELADLEDWTGPDDLRRRVQMIGPLTLTTATDGNHGRAVARSAALLGVQARIFVPRHTAQARIEAIESEGAECVVVDGSYDDAVERAKEIAADDCLVVSDTSWPGYETIPAWATEGYETLFAEVDEQLAGERLDVALIPVGVGALGAAAVRHYRNQPHSPTLVGIEPMRAECVMASIRAGERISLGGTQESVMAGLNCGTPSLVAWPDIAVGFEWYVGIPDELIEPAMRRLADIGVVSGETGAASLAALTALTESDTPFLEPDSSVLLLSTEGATDPAFYRRVVGQEPAQVISAASPNPR